MSDRMRLSRAKLVLGCLLLVPLLSACDPPRRPLAFSAPSFGAGTLQSELRIGPRVVAGTLRVWLDGQRLLPSPLPGGAALVESEIAEGGHVLFALARVRHGRRARWAVAWRPFVAPRGAPDLLASVPAPGEQDVPRSEWLVLDYATQTPKGVVESFTLACAGEELGVAAHEIAAGRVVVNPQGAMPAGSACALDWRGVAGPESLAFATAPAGAPAQIFYDRGDLSRTAPYPDDFHRLDPLTCEERSFAVPLPEREADVVQLFSALLNEVNELDGVSPIAHFVVEFSDAVDPTSLPETPEESLDPLATAGLFDLDPESPHYAERIPFRLEVRDDLTSQARRGFTALAFPSIPLEPGGRYGFVVTRRGRVDPGRPLDPSPDFAAALESGTPGEARDIACTRALLAPLFEVVEHDVVLPIPREDVALALHITVRSLEALPADMLAVRAIVEAAPRPDFTIDAVEEPEDPESPVAAVVRGTWQRPDFRDGSSCVAPGNRFARDPSGAPVLTRSCPTGFTLALPRSAPSAPLVYYQHGNPGSAEAEVPRQAERFLAEAGFAVIGFADILNRELSPIAPDDETAILLQVAAIVNGLLREQRVPDFWAETNAEQQAFLQLIEALADLDLLPLDAPDGVADLDLEAPLAYMGISQGANHAPAFVPYAPEIESAALVVGGSRLTEVLIHQQPQAFLETLPFLFPNMGPADIWVGLSLFQAAYDRQDAHNHARFWFREPQDLGFAGKRASVLVVEGLEDSLVPNHATDSLAWQLGPLPHLEPVARPVPFLEPTSAPIRANIDARTSAAYTQYVPQGVPGIEPTPGCVPPAVSERTANEGHFCAQSADESRRQRVLFFQTALVDAAPTIANPEASAPAGEGVEP